MANPQDYLGDCRFTLKTFNLHLNVSIIKTKQKRIYYRGTMSDIYITLLLLFFIYNIPVSALTVKVIIISNEQLLNFQNILNTMFFMLMFLVFPIVPKTF